VIVHTASAIRNGVHQDELSRANRPDDEPTPPPGNNNRPRGQGPNQGPPDLDELWRDFNRKLGGLFGGRRGGGGGFGGGGGGCRGGGGGGMPPQIVGEAKGVVKFFNGQKGFGFIVRDDGGEDVFVHISAVERAGMRSLVEGQKVQFDVQPDRKTGKSAATNLQAL